MQQRDRGKGQPKAQVQLDESRRQEDKERGRGHGHFHSRLLHGDVIGDCRDSDSGVHDRALRVVQGGWGSDGQASRAAHFCVGDAKHQPRPTTTIVTTTPQAHRPETLASPRPLPQLSVAPMPPLGLGRSKGVRSNRPRGAEERRPACTSLHAHRPTASPGPS